MITGVVLREQGRICKTVIGFIVTGKDNGQQTKGGCLAFLPRKATYSRWWVKIPPALAGGCSVPTLGITGVTPYYIDTEGLLIFHKHSIILDTTLTHEFQITNKIIFYPQIKTLISNHSADGFRSGISRMEVTLGTTYQYNGSLEIFAEGYRDHDYSTKVKIYGTRIGIKILAF